ncbi:hypothetical protein QJQ45_020817 [Haematococcus lacustris]|nr:hypothetical protein QJQ45_020817 [Haematococcus lacustris]
MNSACPVACKQCSPAELNASDYVGLQLLMNTSFGGIKVRPLWENAARTAALIMDLALQPDSSKKACRFYRSEAVPPAGSDGPPYGLLQGSLAGVVKAPPAEGTSLPLYGTVAMITGTTEFYISLMDHSSWGGAHTVWGQAGAGQAGRCWAGWQRLSHDVYGQKLSMKLWLGLGGPGLMLTLLRQHNSGTRAVVENMEVVEAIVKASKFTEFKHPEHGTVMRMMDPSLAFTPLSEPLEPALSGAEL